MSTPKKKITVLLDPDEFRRFDRFCRLSGYKKSTLLVRLIRDFLNASGGEPESLELPMNDRIDRNDIRGESN